MKKPLLLYAAGGFASGEEVSGTGKTEDTTKNDPIAEKMVPEEIEKGLQFSVEKIKSHDDE